MGKEHKYDLKLAEQPVPPKSDSDDESSLNEPGNCERNSGHEIHPTTYLKTASVTLLRVILLSCGIEAERVQFSALRTLSSVLRGIISNANRSDFSSQTLLGIYKITILKT